MRSIERTLLAWIIGALSAGAVVVVVVTYWVTLEEMNEVFDGDLKNVAEAVSSYHESVRGTVDAGRLALPQRSDEPDDSEIVTLTWSLDGQRIYASDPRVKLPFVEREGLARPRVEGEDWIVFSSVGEHGVAQAAQRVSQRRQMAGESAVQVVLPMLALIVAVGALLVFGLRRGLRPLDTATRDIAARSALSLDPIAPGDVPREIAPLVASINGLIARLATAFSAQRRFLADAAHELRTPVTALRLQLQLLRRATDTAARDEALAELESGIARSQRLIEQLLHVARAGPDGETTRRAPVDLGALVRGVVGELSVQAEQAEIDLGASAPAGIVVQGDRDQLVVLLVNLIENALRYTPAGGVVDVTASVREGHAEVRVVDDGHGIPEAERERGFERFVRGEEASAQSRDRSGSGLGLAIVRAIADRHGARVTLHTPGAGRGLEVRVVFAAA